VRARPENGTSEINNAQLGGTVIWLTFCLGSSAGECDRDALPSGAYTFAFRKAYRLAYRPQRETPRDRALSAAFALIRVAKSRTGAA